MLHFLFKHWTPTLTRIVEITDNRPQLGHAKEMAALTKQLHEVEANVPSSAKNLHFEKKHLKL
jgi:hypothetical protein